jgi:hypothetical protein
MVLENLAGDAEVLEGIASGKQRTTPPMDFFCDTFCIDALQDYVKPIEPLAAGPGAVFGGHAELSEVNAVRTQAVDNDLDRKAVLLHNLPRR